MTFKHFLGIILVIIIVIGMTIFIIITKPSSNTHNVIVDNIITLKPDQKFVSLLRDGSGYMLIITKDMSTIDSAETYKQEVYATQFVKTLYVIKETKTKN